MPEITIRQGSAALREVEYLKDEGVSASDGLEINEATLRWEDAFDGRRPDVKHGSGGTLQPMAVGGRTAAMTITGELKGGESSFTNPLTQWPLYHVALGTGLSGVAAAGAIQLSLVEPDESGSFTYLGWQAGKLFKVLGCRGSLAFSADAPGLGTWEFTGNGVLAPGYPIEQQLPTITYPTQSLKPPTWVKDGSNASVDIGGWTPVVRSYRVEMNNVVVPRLDGNNVTGHAGFLITNRAPTWGLPSEIVALNAYDPWKASASGTVYNTIIRHGTSHNKLTFQMPYASVGAPEQEDESGLWLYNLAGEAHIDQGNDELKITVGT